MLKGINKPNQAQKLSRKQLIHKQRKPYEKVAEGMEAQFLNHMMNELRKTAPPTQKETQAEKIYKSLLDGERSETMAKQGMGIKQMVLKQILPDSLKLPNEKVYRENLNKDIKKGNPYQNKTFNSSIKMRGHEGEKP